MFLVPGEKTQATDQPTVGWTINGTSYTALARPGVSIRLWPAEGQLPTDPKSPTSSSFNIGTSIPEASTSSAVNVVEVSLIDWGSVLQVASIQTLAGHGISPAYPVGIARLPTMLFIGDSTTSGFIHPSPTADPQEYCGFMDAFPSHLRTLLSPGVRVYAVAFPGIKLVDSTEQEGMESKWFKAGPFDGRLEWDFAERDGESGPTHIFINLGAHDDIPTEKFIETYESFLNMLKETHGRRTGDILVAAPFGEWDEEKGKYVGHYPEIKDMIQKIKERWESENPWERGDFPSSPMLELVKMQYRSDNTAHLGIPGFVSYPSPPGIRSNGAVIGNNGLPLPDPHSDSLTSPRPSLMVRPSSIAAVEPSAQGTKARLHYIDTDGWLDSRSDTFDGLHPTRQGAIKIAQNLKHWLATNGFLQG